MIFDETHGKYGIKLFDAANSVVKRFWKIAAIGVDVAEKRIVHG